MDQNRLKQKLDQNIIARDDHWIQKSDFPSEKSENALMYIFLIWMYGWIQLEKYFSLKHMILF